MTVQEAPKSLVKLVDASVPGACGPILQSKLKTVLVFLLLLVLSPLLLTFLLLLLLVGACFKPSPHTVGAGGKEGWKSPGSGWAGIDPDAAREALQPMERSPDAAYCRDVSRALALAFEKDPLVRCYVHDNGLFHERSATMFYRMMMVYCLPPCGVCMSNPPASGQAVGATLWSRPGFGSTLAKDARIVPAVLAATAFRPSRLLVVLQYAYMQMVTHDYSRDHFYLSVAGVHPAAQGKGLGGALLKGVLDECDAKGLPAYLESSNPANLSFYLRHGFKATRVWWVGGKIPITLMWREPRGGADAKETDALANK